MTLWITFTPLSLTLCLCTGFFERLVRDQIPPFSEVYFGFSSSFLVLMLLMQFALALIFWSPLGAFLCLSLPCNPPSRTESVSGSAFFYCTCFVQMDLHDRAWNFGTRAVGSRVSRFVSRFSWRLDILAPHAFFLVNRFGPREFPLALRFFCMD